MQADSLPAEPQEKPKNTGVGSLSLLQRIFPTQESNRGLLHYRKFLYQLSYQGSPYFIGEETQNSEGLCNLPKLAELGIPQENPFSKSKHCWGMKLTHGCLPQLGHQPWSALSATVRLGSPREQALFLSHTLWDFLFFFIFFFLLCFNNF